MRVGLAVSSNKFTGAAAVAELWCRALHAAGCEARLLFVAGANLERRLAGLAWALPDLTKERRPADVSRNLRAFRNLAATSDAVITFLPHDHFEAVIAGVHRHTLLVRAFRNPRHLRRDPLHRWLARRCSGSLAPFESLTAPTAALIGGRPTACFAVPVEDRFIPGPDPRETRELLGMDPDTPVIGMVGKLAQGRGFETLLDAASRTRIRCQVLAVGHGGLLPKLQLQAQALAISDRVTWAGKREDDLPKLFGAMDAVVFGAPGSDWGHRAISEAQGCGRPVIAMDIAGVEDLLEEETTGLIATGADSIAHSFDRLVEDSALARKLGQAASVAVAERRFAAIGRQLASFLEGMNAIVRSPSGGTI